jgi:(S)-mandelate dehydrogenase
VCAGGARGAQRALEILHQEAHDAMGLLGAATLQELDTSLMMRAGSR